jgi:hypothetical protein
MKSRKARRNRRNKTRRGGNAMEELSPRYIDFDADGDDTQLSLDRTLLNKQIAYRKKYPTKQDNKGRNQQVIDDNEKYLRKILSFTGVTKKEFNRFIEESDINKSDENGERAVDIIRKFFQEKINHQMALREQALLKRLPISIAKEKTKRLTQLESLLQTDDFDGVLAGIRTDGTSLFGENTTVITR